MQIYLTASIHALGLFLIGVFPVQRRQSHHSHFSFAVTVNSASRVCSSELSLLRFVKVKALRGSPPLNTRLSGLGP